MTERITNMKDYITKAIALAAALTTFCAANTGFSAVAADTPVGDSMLRGNLNGDVQISVEDAQLALTAAAEILAGNDSGIDPSLQPLADVDRDGDLTVKDAQFILQYYVQNTLLEMPTDWDALLYAGRPKNQVPDKNDTLTILCWTDDELAGMIEHFTTANPKYQDHVQYVNVGMSGGESREVYASYLASGKDADLIVTEADWILDYTDNDKLTRPITDLGFNESDFGGCYPYTLSVGRNSSGVLKSVTYTAWPGGYVYRSDLAKQYLGVSSPAEMQPLVKDWDTFMETAAKLKKASDGKTAMVASRGDLVQPLVFANHGKAYEKDGSTYKLIVPDTFKSFYDCFKTAQAEGYYATYDQWTEDWYEVGYNDQTLGYFFSSWCLGRGAMLENAEGCFQTTDGNAEKGKSFGKYNITEGPSPWFWGGYWLMLGANADSGTAAHDFIEHFVVNGETMLSYAQNTGNFVNNSWAMKQITRPNPLLGGQSEFAVLDRNAKAINLEGVIAPNYFYTIWDFYGCAIDAKSYEDAVAKLTDLKANGQNTVSAQPVSDNE